MVPTIYTERLMLRQIIASDIDKVFEGLSDPVVTERMAVRYASLEETKVQMDWYEGMTENDNGRCWAICSKTNEEFYGVVSLPFWNKQHRKTELGYWLLPAYWRQGYVREALAAVVDHAFREMNVHRILAEVEDDNLASIATLENAGFNYEGTQLECEWVNGRFINLAMYALLNKKER